MGTANNTAVASFKDVSHHFGKFQALNGIDLSIRKGDIYGLLGLNGAGKTTALRLLLGFARLQHGAISLFERSPETNRLKLCERIGATIEGPAFYPYLTGIKNLELLYGLSGRKGKRTPAEAIELVSLTYAADVRVRKYSMGMRQRLYIAQALIGEPELLVFDEPTTNLDPKGILEVRRLLARLNEEEGVTVILSSHRLSEVEDLCNRVAIVHRGRLLAEAAVGDLFDLEECRVEIEIDRTADALTLIKKTGWCDGAEANGSRIETRIPRSRRAELNALLNREGLAVTEFIERRPTLEEYFHQTIERDDDAN